jgi:hypothetical protein
MTLGEGPGAGCLGCLGREGRRGGWLVLDGAATAWMTAAVREARVGAAWQVRPAGRVGGSGLGGEEVGVDQAGAGG